MKDNYLQNIKNLTNSKDNEVVGARQEVAPIHQEFYKRTDTTEKNDLGLDIVETNHFIDVNTTSQGLGKTHWMKEYVKKTDEQVAITTREHAHIKDEFKSDIKKGTHRMGLTKLLRENNYPDDIIRTADKMYDAGVKPSIIAETLLDEDDNIYQEQMEEDPPFFDPLPFNYLKQYQDLDKVFIDEGIDGVKRTYSLDRDLENVEEKIDVLQQLVDDEWCDELQELLEVFKYVFNQYEQHKLFNRFDGSLSRIFNSDINLHVKKVPNDDETSNNDDYYISHIQYLYDMDSDEFQKHFRKLYYMFFDRREDKKLSSELYSIINENLSDGEIKDREAVTAAVEIRRLVETIWESKNMNVVMTEKWTRNGEWHCESGQETGKNHRTFFWMSKPHAFRIFDLALKHNVDIKWAWAGFNEDWFNVIVDRYRDYRMKEDVAEYKIIPERFHPGGEQEHKIAFDKNNMKHHIRSRVTDAAEEIENAEIKADVYKVTRPGSQTFSRSSLSTDINREKYYKDNFKARMSQIAEMLDDTAFIGYMDFLDGDYNPEKVEQQTMFGKLPFKYWDGGGIKGTNDFAEYKRIFMIGTPNKNQVSYIKRYYLMTGEFPQLDSSEVREDTKYNNSSRMDAEYKKNEHGEREYYYSEDDNRVRVVHDMLVNSAISDAAMRLRGMRDQRKQVFVAGVVPENLLEKLGVDRDSVEEIKIHDLVKMSVYENGVLDEYCGESLKQINKYTDIPSDDIKSAARESDDFTYNSGVIKEKTSRSDEDIRDDIIDLLGDGSKTTSDITKSVSGDEKRIRRELEDLEDKGKVGSQEEEGFSRKIEWFLK